jgi:hypothetical protein
LGVYRNAYVGRLVDIVGRDHELLKVYVGDDAFEALARAYVRERPSRTSNARWFSHALPEFLAEAEPYRGMAQLAELARIERALSDAFDAADAPVVTLDELKSMPPEHWSDLVFVPHPSAFRLDLSSNAFAIWTALKSEAEPPAPAGLEAPQRLLVWRHGTMPKVRALEPEEAMMWTEAARAVRFGVLCELAATYDDPEGAALRAARYLQSWISAGLLSLARLTPPIRRR